MDNKETALNSENMEALERAARHTFSSCLQSEIKQKWLAALRSGEIRQAHGVLCDTKETMCCLGVLYDAIKGADSWHWNDVEQQWHSTPTFSLYENDLIDNNGVHMLTESQMKEFGLSEPDAAFLASCNDRQADFETIADIIERYL